MRVMDARAAIERGTVYLCQNVIAGNYVPSRKQFGYRYAWQLDCFVHDLSVVAPVCPEEEEA